MHRLTFFGLTLLLLVALPVRGETIVRLADAQLQVGVDAKTGAIRELIEVATGANQLVANESPFALWILTVRDGQQTRAISADQAGPVRIERDTEGRPGLRLTWDAVPLPDKRPLRVEATVRVGTPAPGQCRWQLSVTKPADLAVKEVRFPRVPRLKPRADAALAVPIAIGRLCNDAGKLLRGNDGKGQRLGWSYPSGTSMQFVAYYSPNEAGFYAACDDTQAYSKTFAMWGDPAGQIHFEVCHLPEQDAAGLESCPMPYGVVLGTFRGDWSAAAAIYRESPAAKSWAERGRLRRGLTPQWVNQTGLWVWNRGRSQEVLVPAEALQKQVALPVSVFWHWWHDCSYDDDFPEYLPPREGAESFRTAVDQAHRQGIHLLPYMNQRLWGTATRSWQEENAQAFAVKGVDGKIHTHVYNLFTKRPTASMCMGTQFWRDKYAGMAQEVVCNLKADGIYMDQACGGGLPCWDPTHGHILGHGRFWLDGFGLLTATMRDRCSTVGRITLAGEHCSEAWIPHLDLMLTLDASMERYSNSNSPWTAIPMFQAVYHSSVVTYGNYASLVYPPYDERWPKDQAPPERLTLLDPKFNRQFCLDHARTFVWGQQPMVANFGVEQSTARRDEIDFVARLAKTRLKTLKYLHYGTWLQEPKVDVPQCEIDMVRKGIYIPLSTSTKTVPAVLGGAWRATDGDVGIALASIDDSPLTVRLPIDAPTFGLTENTVVYRTDHSGRQRLGGLRQLGPTLRLDLLPRDVCVLEFSKE
jgi:hypothetical protein